MSTHENKLVSLLGADITSGEAKTISILVFEFFWSIGLIVLPIFDLFIENWRNLYIAMSMPTICMIFLIKYTIVSDLN